MKKDYFTGLREYIKENKEKGFEGNEFKKFSSYKKFSDFENDFINILLIV